MFHRARSRSDSFHPALTGFQVCQTEWEPGHASTTELLGHVVNQRPGALSCIKIGGVTLRVARPFRCADNDPVAPLVPGTASKADGHGCDAAMGSELGEHPAETFLPPAPGQAIRSAAAQESPAKWPRLGTGETRPLRTACHLEPDLGPAEPIDHAFLKWAFAASFRSPPILPGTRRSTAVLCLICSIIWIMPVDGMLSACARQTCLLSDV